MNIHITFRKARVALCALAAGFFSTGLLGAKVDITQQVRAAGGATITRIAGEVRKTSEDVEHAFDGVTVESSGRVMFKTVPAALQYDIPATFQPETDIKLVSYKVYRTCSDDAYDLPRATTQFKLEALVGEEWVTLHEKDANDPETGWSSSVKEIEYEIPAAKQVVSRSYRFTASANNGSTHEAIMSLDELKFYIASDQDPYTVPAGQTLDVNADPGEAHQYTVYGTLNFNGNRGVLNYDGASVTVKDGGVLNVNCDNPDNYGSYPGMLVKQSAWVTVEAGGLMDIKKNGTLGYDASGLIHLAGGTLHAYSTQLDHIGYLRNIKLSDGAQITGGSIGAGWCTESWSDRNANHATMLVDGTSPSFINTTYFAIGGGRGGTYASVTKSGKVNGEMALDLTVKDVTGDAASDLVVNALVTVYQDFADWPSNKLFLAKAGAGTLELAGGIQGVPGLKLGAGTTLVKGTGNTVGALTVTGDSTLKVADGVDLTLGAIVLEGGTLTLDADLNGCTVYVGPTDQAVLDAIVYCGKTEALAIKDGKLVSTLVMEDPEIGTVTVAVQDITNALFTAEIVQYGQGMDAADLYVSVGTDPSSLGEFVKIGTSEAEMLSVSGLVTNLEEGVTYYYEAKLGNAAGYYSKKTRSGKFRTAPALTTLTTGVAYSGLLQGKINKANDFTTDILTESVDPLEVVPGVVMAMFKVGDGQQGSVYYTNPYTGTQSKWNGSNTTFGYYGEIFLKKDAELHIGKNVDDSGYVKIGDTVLLSHTEWNTYPVVTFTAPETGWYPIEVRIGDGSGGKGVTDMAKFAGNGIAYNIGGSTDPSSSDWQLLSDNAHNGAFLRYCDAMEGYLQMTSVQVDGDDVVVWLGTEGKVGAGTKLMAYYGATDGGENPAGWPNALELVTFEDESELPATKYTLEGLAKFGALRFALLVPGSETVQGWSQFSPVTSFSQVDPVATFEFVGEASETNAVMAVDVAALGLGASRATVYAEVSLSGNFDDTVRTKLGEVTVPSTFLAEINGLTTATTYAVRVVVENDLGKSSVSPVKPMKTYDPSVAHPGDTLTWIGGASATWTTSGALWSVPNGTPVAWLDGCVAKFTNATTVAVAEARTAIGFEVGANVTVTGAALTFENPSTVVYHDNGTLRFENEVNAASGITFDVREQQDVIYHAEMEGNLDVEDKVLFHNVNLADVDTIVATLHCQFGNASGEYTINSALPNKDNGGKAGDYGIFFFEKGDSEWTCQFQGVIYGGSCLNGIKVRLHQVGNDVWGCKVWGKDVYSRSYELFGKDLEAEGVGKNYDEWLFNLELRKTDHLPTEIRTEFSGSYNAKGVKTTVNAGTLAFCGTHTLNCQPQVQNGGVVEFAKGAYVTIPGANGCRFFGNPYYVYGTVEAGGGLANYNLLSDGDVRKGFFVCDGGRYISHGGYDYYGYDGCCITVLPGGVLETVENYAIGCNANTVDLKGGVWEQSYDYRDIYNRAVMLKDVRLSNGAEIKGFIGTMGHDYYNSTYNVEVTGGEPCAINLEVIRLGSWNKKIDSGSSGSGCYSCFNVADVTGDTASDLVITSSFVCASNMTVEAGCEGYYSLNKKGAGTLELTSSSSYAPLCQYQIEEGTVKLGEGASAEFGTFKLKGNGTIDVTEDGSKFAFADSSTIAWTADKTLTIVGFHRRALRFGTDAKALTAEQLAQIKFADKPKCVATLDGKGYLVGPKTGLTLIVR